MAQPNEIMPFSEYLQQLESQWSASDGSGVVEPTAWTDDLVEVPLSVEPLASESGEADEKPVEMPAVSEEALVAVEGSEMVAPEKDASEKDAPVSEEPSTDFVEPAAQEFRAEVPDHSEPQLASDDLDALFQELLKASVSPNPTPPESKVDSEQQEENARVAQLEQQMQMMQQMLQQTLQAVQQTAQIVNLQQETEAFRMVARSLQADGIFLTEQQLRDLWNEAYTKGIPPSLVVKAHAFDMLQRERPNLQAYRQQPPQFPFLTPPPATQDERPNQFRSYREFLQEMQYQQQYQQPPTMNYYNEP